MNTDVALFSSRHQLFGIQPRDGYQNENVKFVPIILHAPAMNYLQHLVRDSNIIPLINFDH